MKKILFNILICSGLITLASCEKKVTTEDPSKVTHYVVFELQGDETMYVPVNSDFTDPGVSATENGVDVKDHVVTRILNRVTGQVVNSIPLDAPGAYAVEYSAVNADGFGVSAAREVIVYDPDFAVSIAGTYDTDINNTIYNDYPFATWIAAKGYPGNAATVTFTELVPGFYYCSDLLAGWYAQIRGYGAKYNMTGIVMLNSDNTISLVSSYVAGWGDGLDYIKNSLYTPETGTLTYDASYAAQIFISPVLVKQ